MIRVMRGYFLQRIATRWFTSESSNENFNLSFPNKPKKLNLELAKLRKNSLSKEKTLKVCDELVKLSHKYNSISKIHETIAVLGTNRIIHPELWAILGNSFMKLTCNSNKEINSLIAVAGYLSKSLCIDNDIRKYTHTIWKQIPSEQLKNLDTKHFSLLCYLTQETENNEDYENYCKEIIKEIDSRIFVINFYSNALNPTAPIDNPLRIQLLKNLEEYTLYLKVLKNPANQFDVKFLQLGALLNKVSKMNITLIHPLCHLTMIYIKKAKLDTPSEILDLTLFIVNSYLLYYRHSFLPLVIIKKYKKIKDFGMFPKGKASEFIQAIGLGLDTKLDERLIQKLEPLILEEFRNNNFRAYKALTILKEKNYQNESFWLNVKEILKSLLKDLDLNNKSIDSFFKLCEYLGINNELIDSKLQKIVLNSLFNVKYKKDSDLFRKLFAIYRILIHNKKNISIADVTDKYLKEKSLNIEEFLELLKLINEFEEVHNVTCCSKQLLVSLIEKRMKSETNEEYKQRLSLHSDVFKAKIDF